MVTTSISVKQRGHLSAHASEGQCVEYANCEILAELKIELSVNITNYNIAFVNSER